MISAEAAVEVEGDRIFRRAKNDPLTASGPDDVFGGACELAAGLEVEDAGGDGVGGLTLSFGGMNMEPEIGLRFWVDGFREVSSFSFSSGDVGGTFSMRTEDARESESTFPRGARNGSLYPVEATDILLLARSPFPFARETERSPCGWMGLKT